MSSWSWTPTDPPFLAIPCQGKKWAYGVSTFQLLNIVLIDIAYTITAGKAMVTLANTACGWQGIDADACFDKASLTGLVGGSVTVSC